MKSVRLPFFRRASSRLPTKHTQTDSETKQPTICSNYKHHYSQSMLPQKNHMMLPQQGQYSQNTPPESSDIIPFHSNQNTPPSAATERKVYIVLYHSTASTVTTVKAVFDTFTEARQELIRQSNISLVRVNAKDPNLWHWAGWGGSVRAWIQKCVIGRVEKPIFPDVGLRMDGPPGGEVERAGQGGKTRKIQAHARSQAGHPLNEHPMVRDIQAGNPLDGFIHFGNHEEWNFPPGNPLDGFIHCGNTEGGNFQAGHIHAEHPRVVQGGDVGRDIPGGDVEEGNIPGGDVERGHVEGGLLEWLLEEGLLEGVHENRDHGSGEYGYIGHVERDHPPGGYGEGYNGV